MQNNMRGILVFLLAIRLFFLSTTAEGADWKFIGRSISGNSVFIDTESINHITKTLIQAWVQFSPKKPTGNLKMQLSYEEHNCSEGKRRILRGTKYYIDGTYEDFPGTGKWEYIARYTLDKAIHDYLCIVTKPSEVLKPVEVPAPEKPTVK